MGRLLQSLFGATDEQMMWRVKMQDDPEAFAALMARWEKPIQALCARMTGDPHRAQDLAQVAFTRVFSRRAEWQGSGRFSTFLWRVALNLCHDDLRRTRRRGEESLDALGADGAERPALVAGDPPPDEQVEAHERGDLVRNALKKLAPHYQEVVVLRHYQGLKFHEIAEVLSIPEGTVKSRMAEALGQLHRLLNHLNPRENTSCRPSTRTPELSVL